jgi:23S rRNA G2069 N7-methylase RlmK/C1962 C5-methylase RlmI
MEFDPKRRDSIIDIATQLATLLSSVGENRWVNIINHAVSLLKEDKFQDGTQLILSTYGGMGSLNDLIIDPYGDHPVSEESAASTNDLLKSYLNELYSLIKN